MAMPPQNTMFGSRQNTSTPQNSNILTSQRAQTNVPQSLTPPTQLNGNAMNNQVQNLQGKGVPAAQSVASAAANPNNRYYKKGGDVKPPSKPELEAKSASTQFDPTQLKAVTNALDGEPALQNQPDDNPSVSDNTFKQYFDSYGQNYMTDRAKMTDTKHYAKGGEVTPQDIHKMPLKDAIKLLVQHPEVMGKGMEGMETPLKSTDLKKGGAVMPSKFKSGNNSAGATGIMGMNDDAGTYSKGGDVPPFIDSSDPSGMDDDSEDEVNDNTGDIGDGKNADLNGGLLKMADGGYSGNSYDPNQYESTQDVNGLLGRPTNASTLGTGNSPNTANSNQSINMLAQGGEEDGPPPGSLSKEVADDVPAKLSEGEFVLSADVVRYYGLKFLTSLQDNARQELAGMAQDGKIRHPGDGMNPDEAGGQFAQDQKPNMDAYSPDQMGEEPDGDEPQPSGIMKQACGGGVKMATGGNVGKDIKSVYNPNQGKPNSDNWNSLTDKHQTDVLNEGDKSDEVFINKIKPKTSVDMAQGGTIEGDEGLRAGGPVYKDQPQPQSPDNEVSGSNPQGAAPNVGYAQGGIVTPNAKSFTPKTDRNLVPTGKAKIPGLKKIATGLNPSIKMKKGGLLKQANDLIVPTQSQIG